MHYPVSVVFPRVADFNELHNLSVAIGLRISISNFDVELVSILNRIE